MPRRVTTSSRRDNSGTPIGEYDWRAYLARIARRNSLALSRAGLCDLAKELDSIAKNTEGCDRRFVTAYSNGQYPAIERALADVYNAASSRCLTEEDVAVAKSELLAVRRNAPMAMVMMHARNVAMRRVGFSSERAGGKRDT